MTVARLDGVGLSYGRTVALHDVTLDVPPGRMVGLIGPDGVGKSSLLSLVSGARAMQTGQIEVLGGPMSSRAHRDRIQPRIAYMPQGLGKNLYPTLTVRENVDFFGRLFGHDAAERARRIGELLKATGLDPFADRLAGKLSGGMKQKLGLCCALIHDPELLILDEPTTGIDPLSRRQFWELIRLIRVGRPTMSVVVATAYMEEAFGFDWLVAMDGGGILATGTPQDLLDRTGAHTLDAAFIALLPEDRRRGHTAVHIPARPPETADKPVIEADNLTKRFGDFTAVDAVSFRIQKGEIFGFLGSNGCGKTTTMKMLTGLLPVSDGQALLLGEPVDPANIAARRHVGYMSQAFSLYTELTVRQNLVLHAHLFHMDRDAIGPRVQDLARRFKLEDILDILPDSLPLGIRQRLSLAAALIHSPEILILDEPTSGVDPVARDQFWETLGDLSRTDGVTIFVSTHFMNEAALCDRISLMHAGRVLVSDAPQAIIDASGKDTLEDAFIAQLEAVVPPLKSADIAPPHGDGPPPPRRRFDPRRLFAYTWREALELRRDPIRATFAVVGSLIMMFVIGYGISMDVEDLRFAALDFDDTSTSRDYISALSGSRYFIEMPPVTSYQDIEDRMRSGELSLALEIPPGFGQAVARGDGAEVGAWLDGSMPSIAETASGYVQGMHAHWLALRARDTYGDAATAGDFDMAVRYRYNPSVESLPAIVPAIIPMLLMIIPAMLAVLSVVREKELGSIINFYATPTTRLEFLLGKQLPYVGFALINYLLMVGFAITVFGVPITGSFLSLTLAAILYVFISTGMGLVISSFVSSQIAALFGTAMATMIPSSQYSGLTDPVSSLEGAGKVIGTLWPTTYFVTISRGVFNKALWFRDLAQDFQPLLLWVPVLLVLGVLLLRKQAK